MGEAACVSLCDCFLHLRLSQEPAPHQSDEVATEAFGNTILLFLGSCGIKYELFLSRKFLHCCSYADFSFWLHLFLSSEDSMWPISTLGEVSQVHMLQRAWFPIPKFLLIGIHSVLWDWFCTFPKRAQGYFEESLLTIYPQNGSGIHTIPSEQGTELCFINNIPHKRESYYLAHSYLPREELEQLQNKVSQCVLEGGVFCQDSKWVE